MRQRRHFTAEEKVRILREHFEEDKSVADVCEKYRVNPKLFYDWKRKFFENALQIFIKAKDHKKEQRKIQQLETDLKDRNEVIAELLHENIKLKKSNGAH